MTKFYGDCAHDTNEMFDAPGDAKSAIRIRSNASTDYCRGSKHRRKEARPYNSLGYDEWSRQADYGMRWPGTEGIFSAAKRKFGENLMATSRGGSQRKPSRGCGHMIQSSAMGRKEWER